MSCPLCGAEPLEPVFRYTEPPAGETAFELPAGQAYEREFHRCPRCGHWVSVHDLDLSALYEGDYVDATYGAGGLAGGFEKVMSLPSERSDNVQRVARIVDRLGASGRMLDVGSGLGVFPARMKEAGWECTALDPDPRAVEFARSEIGVEAICGDYMKPADLGRFDLVSFNKVLEHVEDPVAMLRRSHDQLEQGASVYVEVPDGEMAARDPDGPGREEFFIEHLCCFSMASLSLLVDRAGFEPDVLERLREPSGKYTLWALLSAASSR